MATTLIPRAIKRFGWHPDLPDHRDQVFEGVAAPIPQAVDLRPKFAGIPVFDQGQLGSCTANAIAAAIQYAEAVEGEVKNPSDPANHPSRLHLYWHERFIEGTIGSDAGAMIRDGLKVVHKVGFVDEARWPYDISRFTSQPPADVEASAKRNKVTKYLRVPVSLDRMLHCLASGFPFVFGITVYQSFMSAGSGEIPMPSPGEGVAGGHALLGVGYDQVTQRFRFRNSWSSGWGDAGHGTIPFKYLADPSLGGDYWTIRTESAK